MHYRNNNNMAISYFINYREGKPGEEKPSKTFMEFWPGSRKLGDSRVRGLGFSYEIITQSCGFLLIPIVRCFYFNCDIWMKK